MQQQTGQQLQIYCYICLLKTNTSFALLSIILNAATNKVAFVPSVDCPVCGRFVAFLFNFLLMSSLIHKTVSDSWNFFLPIASLKTPYYFSFTHSIDWNSIENADRHNTSLLLNSPLHLI